MSLLLTGCDTFSLLRDQKIADAFHVGADKRSISRDFGAPIATLPTLNGRACATTITTACRTAP
ncbi:hypothetical protein M8494_16855 [Serratia ureilytica]